MENILLRTSYLEKFVDIRVEDTDKCLLIDVYLELFEKAGKHCMPLPKHPSLSYVFERKKVMVKDDSDLMTMFDRLGANKEIHVIIGSDSSPCKTLELARSVRDGNTEVEASNPQPEQNQASKQAPTIDKSVRFREKIPFRKKPSEPEVAPTDVTGEPVLGSPRSSGRHKSPPITTTPQLTQSPATKSPVPTQASTSVIETPPSTRRSGRLISPSQTPVKSQPTQASINVLPSPSPRRSARLNLGHASQPSPVSNAQSTQVTERNLKIPKTTAVRKGVFVPKGQGQRSDVGEESSRRTRSNAREAVNVGGLSELEAAGSESDDSYMPTDDEEVVDVDEGLSDLEVEDNNILASLEMIDDGYIPFKSYEWCGEDKTYSAQVCGNGEVYDDQDFGNIRLRPWMLFMDKDHFKDVLRDFCIQEGFSVVVVKGDRLRYTADCATLTCEWRIHASVLPDGKTWAIKSIRNPSHGCVGVMKRNPMANCVWVARKMLEDIRANQAISAKSIQDLLMERYGIEMARSSVYKSKDLALTEINGGHDESYSLLPRYCEVIKSTNPGSVAHCSWVPKDGPETPLQFKSLFVALQAQVEGLKRGCRSLIGVDGTHLKGNYGGILLSAVGLDGNNELFPFAIGIVESENKDSQKTMSCSLLLLGHT